MKPWSISAPVEVSPNGDVKSWRKEDGIVMGYEHPEDHPAYNSSLQCAARRAWENREEGHTETGYYPPCFTVYFAKDGKTIYVRDSKAAPPPNAKTVCIAQHFTGGTVQLRFDGARSQWVEF